MNPETHYYQHDGRTYLSVEGFAFLRDNDLIIDATEGGLIIGPQLNAGGITLVDFTVKGEYHVNAPTDGWSYLLNAYAFFYKQKQFDVLGCTLIQRAMPHFDYNVPESVMVYDATPRLVEGKLITPVIFTGSPETAFIDRVTTRHYLERIHELNQNAWKQYHKGYRKTEDINVVGTAAHFVPRSDN